MRVGFTGTRDGLKPQQSHKLIAELSSLPPGTWLHHGDCRGADHLAHDFAVELGIQTEVHPPTDDRLRAWCVGNVVREPKPYIERNHDIVDVTDGLIACPSTMYEEVRSGTWATVRYARRVGKPILIVFPDGTIKEER